MTKKTQILLTRPLTVNLGTDEHGRAITEKLIPGLQYVDSKVAENWFVKAHCQEISIDDLHNAELQEQLDKANADLVALQAQSDAATLKIKELEQSDQEKDQQIKDLQTLLAKAEQAQTGAVKQADTPADAETKTKGK